MLEGGLAGVEDVDHGREAGQGEAVGDPAAVPADEADGLEAVAGGLHLPVHAVDVVRVPAPALALRKALPSRLPSRVA